jgi:multisubunit Na+/H+ antiporter MnhC subunit
MQQMQRDRTLKTPTALVIAAVVLSIAMIAVGLIVTRDSDSSPAVSTCTENSVYACPGR